MNTNKIYHCTASGIHVYIDGTKKDFIPFDRYEKPKQKKAENNNVTLNYKQRRLFKECLYGLSNVSLSDVKKLSISEKIRINDNHKRTQRLINLSKWKVASEMTSHSIKLHFIKENRPEYSKDYIPKVFQLFFDTEVHEDDNRQINYLPLKILGRIENIIDKMVENEILPQNFYQLK